MGKIRENSDLSYVQSKVHIGLYCRLFKPIVIKIPYIVLEIKHVDKYFLSVGQRKH